VKIGIDGVGIIDGVDRVDEVEWTEWIESGVSTVSTSKLKAVCRATSRFSGVCYEVITTRPADM